MSSFQKKMPPHNFNYIHAKIHHVHCNCTDISVQLFQSFWSLNKTVVVIVVVLCSTIRLWLTKTSCHYPIWLGVGQFHLSPGGGRGGGRPREKGTGGVWQVGEERVGSGRKRGKVATLHNILQSKKTPKRKEPTNTGREPGLKGTRSGRFKPPIPPPISICFVVQVWLLQFEIKGRQQRINLNQNQNCIIRIVFSYFCLFVSVWQATINKCHIKLMPQDGGDGKQQDQVSMPPAVWLIVCTDGGIIACFLDKKVTLWALAWIK